MRLKATVTVSPIPNKQVWTIGWVQSCIYMDFVNVYGQHGFTSWEFPQLNLGLAGVNDSDGESYPFYGHEREICQIYGPTNSSYKARFARRTRSHSYQPQAKVLLLAGSLQRRHQRMHRVEVLGLERGRGHENRSFQKLWIPCPVNRAEGSGGSAYERQESSRSSMRQIPSGRQSRPNARLPSAQQQRRSKAGKNHCGSSSPRSHNGFHERDEERSSLRVRE